MIEDSLFGRFKRYSNVTTAVGGLVARLFGDRYLGVSLDQPEHAEALKETLGHLKGPLMKIAQILATVPDMLPKEYATAFLELQSNAPPMGWPFVKRRMQAELGKNWQSLFASFEPQARAAASLGQVHKAVSKDGKILACKLQYPEMGSAVEADLNQLSFILKSFEAYSGAINTKNLRSEIGSRLREELDYTLEAKHMKLFAEILASYQNVVIPDVIEDLSTKKLLTMTWVDGEKLLNLVDSPQELRNLVSVALFKAWYFPLYQYGVLHGDPHLGNYSWSKEQKLNLLDFGCVRIFPASFIQGVINLYQAFKNNDEELAVHAYTSWGFKNVNRELLDVLNLWARFLYEPLLDDRVRPIEQTLSGVRGREVAGAVLQALKKQGGVTPPKEFVFMDRAAVGMGSVFMHLKAEANWHQIFEDLIEGFSEEKLILKQEKALKKGKLL